MFSLVFIYSYLPLGCIRTSGVHIYYSIGCVVIILGLPSIFVIVLVWFLHICGDGLWLFKSVSSLSGWSLFVVDCGLFASSLVLSWLV